jgi:glyoxylase-like metal-dependent hydrolase (beta-lactamase superfamily II)
MRELAPEVWQLGGLLPNVINTYLIGGVLVDAGSRFDARKILKELRGHEVRAHALTHAHPDHQGSSHAVCTTLGVPFWVGEADADAAENPKLIAERQPNHPIAQASYRVFTGPGHPVDRRLRAGDEVGGFTVIDTPDPARNRASARALGPLAPELVCSGHGKPLRDAQKFQPFCASL